MQLHTNRLLLREILPTDAPAIMQYCQNLEVTKWLAVVPYPYAQKDAAWYIAHAAEKMNKSPREDYSLAIALKETNAFIGTISLRDVNSFQGTANIGYWIGAPFQRKGYMFEAAQELLRFAFEYLKIRRLTVSAFADNAPSNALIVKLGFTLEGKGAEAVVSKATGKIHDEFFYGLLAKDWEKAHPIIKQ